VSDRAGLDFRSISIEIPNAAWERWPRDLKCTYRLNEEGKGVWVVDGVLPMDFTTEPNSTILNFLADLLRAVQEPTSEVAL
jgi:hypothetical protein